MTSAGRGKPAEQRTEHSFHRQGDDAVCNPSMERKAKISNSENTARHLLSHQKVIWEMGSSWCAVCICMAVDEGAWAQVGDLASLNGGFLSVLSDSRGRVLRTQAQVLEAAKAQFCIWHDVAFAL